jgi:flagellar biogenesis protein FliO
MHALLSSQMLLTMVSPSPTQSPGASGGSVATGLSALIVGLVIIAIAALVIKRMEER